MADPKKEWFSRKEASAYLESIGCPLAANTLAKMAENDNEGGGPPFTRIRWRIVRYRRTDLDAWVDKVSVRIK